MVPAEGLLGVTRLALPLTLRGRPKGRSPPSLPAGVVEPACLSVGVPIVGAWLHEPARGLQYHYDSIGP
jgi:hypothetical protein